MQTESGQLKSCRALKKQDPGIAAMILIFPPQGRQCSMPIFTVFGKKLMLKAYRHAFNVCLADL
jgi:hypothetical protein